MKDNDEEVPPVLGRVLFPPMEQDDEEGGSEKICKIEPRNLMKVCAALLLALMAS
jgi:hypothetical protein